MPTIDDYFDDVKAAYGQGGDGHARVITLAESTWSEHGHTPPEDADDRARLGEICRRAAIAAVATDRPEASVWRSRALAMFTTGRCSNGVAMLLLPPALGDLKAGRKRQAIDQMALMHLLVNEDDPVIPPEMVRSAAFENAGVAHLVDADLPPDPARAREHLHQALPIERAAGDHRRILKIQASLATATYLSGDAAGAIEELQAVIAECEASDDARDVLETARANLARMTAPATLAPYQVI